MRYDYDSTNQNYNNTGSTEEVYGSFDENQTEGYVDLNRVGVRADLINTYKEIDFAVSLKEQEEQAKQEEINRNSNFDDAYNNFEENKSGGENQPPKKKSKKLLIGIIISSVVVIVIAVLLFIFVINPMIFKDNGNDTAIVLTESDMQDMQYEINLLYADDLKSSIKDGYKVSDLDGYRLELKNAPSGELKTSIINELNTIENYMNDSETLKVYEDLGYNLEPAIVGDTCSKIQQGTDKYTVDGLKATIYNRAGAVIKERNEYVGIKGELSKVSDPINFSESNYQSRIDTINHTINKAEVQSMFDSLVADKEVAVAEKAMKEAKSEQERKDAEASLGEAKKRQEETDQALADAQSALEEALKKLEEKETEGITEEVSKSEKSSEVSSEENSDNNLL